MVTEYRFIEDTVRGIKESNYEIQTESRLAYSGLKREQNIAEILEKYAWLYNLQTIRRLETAYGAETEPENSKYPQVRPWSSLRTVRRTRSYARGSNKMMVFAASAGPRSRDERCAGGSVRCSYEVSLDARGHSSRSLGHDSRAGRVRPCGPGSDARRGAGGCPHGPNRLVRIQAAGQERRRQEVEQQEEGGPPHLPPASGRASPFT